MNFGQALEEVKKGKGMRLPQWKPADVILAQFDRPPFVQSIQPDPDPRFHLTHDQQPQHPFTCHVFLPDSPAQFGCPAR